MKQHNPLLFLTLAMFLAVQAVSGQSPALRPEFSRPVYFDVSPPLRDLLHMVPQPYDGSWKDGAVPNYITDPSTGLSPADAARLDAVLQDAVGDLPSDTTLQNFDGLNNGSGYVPPDTHGEAGPNHYFQVVNCSYAIYNKSGARILGPLANSSIWAGMPNNENSGDAIIHYDEQANRWLFSQFSLPNGSSTAPFYMMIAVSQTPDPTGSWYRYQYEFSSMPDYPKFGIWPDGYYLSTNNFGPSPAGWVGNGACAFQREAMLAGDPDALRISFTLSPSGEGFISLLPSDCDGTFPPEGTPNYFTYIRTSGTQRLGIFEFYADWENPVASTFGNVTYLPVTPFSTPGSGIPQLGTDKKLETLADRLMYRLQYRKFNGYASMVLNHTVNSGMGHAGIRWYELQNTGSGWSIYQQSTYAPNDGNSRWMASIAQDTAGSIALGFSVSGTALYPGIRYTGRKKSDPLNQMTIAEKAIMHGGGCQTGIWSGRSRWGDYSGMSVDPASPTTFWYTTEYYASTSSSVWSTRIASFTFDNVFSSSASATPGIMCSTGIDSVQLRAYAYGGSGSYTYNWSSVPAGFTSTLPDPKVVPVTTTRYAVEISDGTFTRHDTTEVKIVTGPVATAGSDTMVCAWVPAVPMNASASNYSKVAWGTTGDGHFTLPNAIETEYIPGPKDLSTGSVSLKLLVMPISPCYGNISDVKVIQFDPCTGISGTGDLHPGFTLFPNPATDKLTILLSGAWDTPVLTILDSEGREVQRIPAGSGHTPDHRISADIHDLVPGLYIVRLQQEGQVVTQRFVKQ